MSTLIKFPGDEDERVFAFEFAEQPEIKAGDTLANVTSVTATRKKGTSESATLGITFPQVSGTKAVFLLAGGELEETYEIVCKVTTTAGRKMAAVGLLKITRE